MAPTPGAGQLRFSDDFASGGYKPFTSAQCANYGTPSKRHRLRGDFYVIPNPTGPGDAAEFSLPVDSGTSPVDGTRFTYTDCGLTRARTEELGGDDYFGLMVYIPGGFNVGTHSFWGITIAQFNTDYIWGSPFELELHNNHITLALQTGTCSSSTTVTPGCDWHSNAGAPGGPGNLPTFYAVPRDRFHVGWTKLILHVHWATDSTGSFETWMRAPDQITWTRTAHFSGIPTVQTNRATPGALPNTTTDEIGAYRAHAFAPVNVVLDDFEVGSSMRAVQAALSNAG
ncbi:MAG: polysaccharide lyase [Actinobacteria bacterium]|nr:polysaccharide lyase [Actinomycetota bacterium]